jgi:hypothetical protein
LLIAHYVVRAVMVEAAELHQHIASHEGDDPGGSAHRAKADHARLYRGLLEDVAARPLAPRANRCNPRVVKRKMSKFRVKSESHRIWPQPTKPFQEAVVLLN